MYGSKVTELWVGISTSDINAALELRVQLKTKDNVYSPVAIGTGKSSPTFPKMNTDLAQGPIPGAGIGVPGVWQLGAWLSLSISANMALDGNISFIGGVHSRLSAGRIFIDALHPERSYTTGFEASAEPVHEVEDFAFNFTSGVGMGPQINLGFDFLNTAYKAALGAGIKTPALAQVFGSGFCESPLKCHFCA